MNINPDKAKRVTIFWSEGWGEKRYSGNMVSLVYNQPLDGMVTFRFLYGKELSLWITRLNRIEVRGVIQ